MPRTIADDPLIKSLVAHLDRRGITQARLSEMTNISQGNLSQMLTGAKSPRIQTLRRVLDELELELVIAPKTAKKNNPKKSDISD